jgi:hypothetical protein
MRFFILFLLVFSSSRSFSQGFAINQILSEEGFENIYSTNYMGDLYLSYENNLYRFEAKGLSKVFSLISSLDIREFRQIFVLIRSKDIPMVMLRMNSLDLILYRDGSLDRSEFISKIYFSFNVDKVNSILHNSQQTNSSFMKIDNSYGLGFDYALGDFNDGFKSRVILNTMIQSVFSRGLDVHFKFNSVLQNDLPGRALSSPNSFFLSQSFRFLSNSFINLNIGYLPQDRYGLNFRYRNYIQQERFYIEFFSSLTRLGYLDQNWSVISNRNSDAAWQIMFNYRWNKYDTDVNLTYGTFLSGDLGYKVQFTRQFDEIYFNLFYARTDVLSSGSFGSSEEGILGFSIQVPFGQSRYLKPKSFRIRTTEQFNLLYRYSGYSLSGIDINSGQDLLSDIREFYPEVLRSGLMRYLEP